MWTKQFFGKNFFLRFLMINFLIFIFAIFFEVIPNLKIFMFPIGELLLFVVVSITTINFYQKFNNNFFINHAKLNSVSKKQIKLKSFLLVFWYSTIFIILFIFYFFLLNQRINWKNYAFFMYFKLMFLETIVLIAFNYFLLHFIKNINIIFIIFFTLFFLMLVFGNLFHHFIDVKELFLVDDYFPKNNYFLTWQDKDTSTMFMISAYITTIFTPWQNFGMIGKNLSYHTENSLKDHIFHWWNSSYLGIYYNNQPNFWFQNFEYTPIIFTLLYLLIPFIFKKPKRKK